MNYVLSLTLGAQDPAAQPEDAGSVMAQEDEEGFFLTGEYKAYGFVI